MTIPSQHLVLSFVDGGEVMTFAIRATNFYTTCTFYPDYKKSQSVGDISSKMKKIKKAGRHDILLLNAISRIQAIIDTLQFIYNASKLTRETSLLAICAQC